MNAPKKTHSGKWHLTLYIGKDENGKRVYKSVTAKTKAECTEKAKALKRDLSVALTRPKIADLSDFLDLVDIFIVWICSAPQARKERPC